MKSRSVYPCALVLLFALSGCATPTAIPTATLHPKPTVTQTLTPTLTPEPTETPTPQPTITETSTPRPTLVFPKACGAVTLGKPGTQSQDKTHPVLVQGTAILCNEIFRDGPDESGFFTSLPIDQARLDLDTGKTGSEDADIWFDVFGGSMFFFGISEINHSETATVEIRSNEYDYTERPREPTFDECQDLDNLKSKYHTDNEPNDVCVITNAGHIARIKVEKFSPIDTNISETYSIKISFITWDVLVPTITPTP